jgi:hypothetical protein
VHQPAFYPPPGQQPTSGYLPSVPSPAPIPREPPLSIPPPTGPPPVHRPPSGVRAPPPSGGPYRPVRLPPAPPQNPPIFGLSPLDEIRSFDPSGALNSVNLAFVGASVGPLMAANDARDYGSRRKLLSGQHATSCEEVKSQLYWPHQLLDVCALGGA